MDFVLLEANAIFSRALEGKSWATTNAAMDDASQVPVIHRNTPMQVGKPPMVMRG